MPAAAAVLSTGRGAWAHVWAEVEVSVCVCEYVSDKRAAFRCHCGPNQ